MNISPRILPVSFALAGLAGFLTSCTDDGIGGACGLSCPADGVAEGNASISGIVSLDAYFGAVISVRDASVGIANTIRAELEGMAASLGVEGYAEMSLDELSTAVEAELQLEFEANLEGGLTIDYAPPKCEADLELAAKAAAECDADVDPGSVEARCMGTCEVNAEVAAQCQADGTLRCEGKAPMFQCDGTCTGTCQLDVMATCEGSCTGTCTGNCSACTGGECQTDMNGDITNCMGSCDAMCQGTCELEAGGSCSGDCEGSCEYDPGGAECEAGATAKCDVSAMADAQCEGKCEGSVEPPQVSAECEATVEAKAKAEVTCTPPELTISFQFKDTVSLEDQAEFRVWLQGFKARFAAMAAARAKLDGVQVAVQGLIDASVDVIPNVVSDIEAEGGLSLQVIAGLGCALDEAEQVGVALEDAGTSLSGSVTAFGRVAGAVGAGG